MNSKSDTIDAELDEILEDFEIWAANQYTDKVYAKQGIKFNEAKAKLKALLLRERATDAEKHIHDCLLQYAETGTVSCYETAKSKYDTMYNEGLSRLSGEPTI